MEDHAGCPSRSDNYLIKRYARPSSSSSSSVLPFLQPKEEFTFTGCKWTGKSSDIHAHLETCEFVKQKCPKCQQELPRKYLDSHLNSCKGEDGINCPICFLWSPTIEESLKHVHECEMAPMVCDYCNMKIPFKYMESHTDECAEYPLFCRKCQQEGPRRFMTFHQIGGKCIVYHEKTFTTSLIKKSNGTVPNQNLESSADEGSDEKTAAQTNSTQDAVDQSIMNPFITTTDEDDGITVRDFEELAKIAGQNPENVDSASFLNTVRKYRENVHHYDGATFDKHIDEGIQRLGEIYIETKHVLNKALAEIQAKDRKIEVNENIIKNLSQDIRSSTDLNHRMVLACKHRDEQLYQLKELEKIISRLEKDEKLTKDGFIRMVNSIPSKRPVDSHDIKTENESNTSANETGNDNYLTDEFSLHTSTKRKMRMDAEERIRMILESSEAQLENGCGDEIVTKDKASTSLSTGRTDHVVNILKNKADVKENEKGDQKKAIRQKAVYEQKEKVREKETGRQKESAMQRETSQQNEIAKHKEIPQLNGTPKDKETAQCKVVPLEKGTSQQAEAAQQKQTVTQKDVTEECTKVEGDEKEQQEEKNSTASDTSVSDKSNFCMNILQKQRSLKRQASDGETEEDMALKRPTTNGAISDSDSDTFEF